MKAADGTRWLLACIAVACAAGCLEADATQCDGYICPSYMVCDVAHGGCVLDDQLARCEGAEPLSQCSVATVEVGRCYDGVCLPAGCGNRFVDPDEVCDDGNTIPGDFCSLDCRSDEQCGTGYIDLINGEACDDGDLDRIGSDGCSGCELEVERWRQSVPAARTGHALAFDSRRGRVVMFGGTATIATNETWEWDGSGWRQVATQVTPPPRFDHAMAYDADRGVVVLFGGRSVQGRNDTWEFDGTRWTEVHPATSPPLRFEHALAYDAERHEIVMFGGRNFESGYVDETWVYDGATWTLREPAVKPSQRARAAMAYDAVRKQVVLFGGQGAFGPPDATTWLWNGTTWTNVMDGPPARQGHAMAFDPSRGDVILTGGNTSGGIAGDTWSWNGTTWSATGFPNLLRDDLALAFDGSTVISVHGRIPGGRNPFTYRRTDAEWQQVQKLVRLGGAVAYDSARGAVVSFGGLDAGDAMNTETWIKRGAGWELAATVGPPASLYNAMAYDRARKVAVTFGGHPGTETWEWNGEVWTEVDVPGPPARLRHAMAFDAKRNQIVLFGGRSMDLSEEYGDTWLYDGTSWVQQQASAAPPARYGHAMTYDAEREVVVLTGGGAGTSVYGDTWFWDGAAWTQGPAFPARAGHVMCFHPLARLIYAFGGETDIGLNDTWRWDGLEWNEVFTPVAPLPRGDIACAFDEARAEIVVLGGNQLAEPDDTWLLRLEPLSRQLRREICELNVDADGDGVAGCDDPDCWGYCTPECPPGRSCDPSAPRCGDLECTGLETHLNCASDCP